MTFGLGMGLSTASTASMFSFASGSSQLDQPAQSVYVGQNPYVGRQNAGGGKPLSAVSPPAESKAKGIGKAFSGIARRFGPSSRKCDSVSRDAEMRAASELTDSTNHFNSDFFYGGNCGFSGCPPPPDALRESSSACAAQYLHQHYRHALSSNDKAEGRGGLVAAAAAAVAAAAAAAHEHPAQAGLIRTCDMRSVGSGGGPAKKKSKSNLTKVVHQYQDYSNVTDEDALQDTVERKNTGGVVTPFPEKLHEMLLTNKDTDVIDWAPHGRCFIIKKPKVFAVTIMPKHFKHTKITSFQRQLNLYGFKRITKGKDRGAYYHELFLRGRPKLSTKMRRQRIKGVGHKPLPDPDNEPDFYTMEPLDPPTTSAAAASPSSSSSDGGAVGGRFCDAASFAVLSGALHPLSPAAVRNGGNLCAMRRDDDSFSRPMLPNPVVSGSGGSGGGAIVSMQQHQRQQSSLLEIAAQQRHQLSMSSVHISPGQQSDELQLISQLIEQQRRQLEQQQLQLQQRQQQQLLQEKLIEHQKEALLRQQQELEEQMKRNLMSRCRDQQKQQQQQQQLPPRKSDALSAATRSGASTSDLEDTVGTHHRRHHRIPTNMSVNVPSNCDAATIADFSAVSCDHLSEVGDDMDAAAAAEDDPDSMELDNDDDDDDEVNLPAAAANGTGSTKSATRTTPSLPSSSKSSPSLKAAAGSADVPHILRDLAAAAAASRPASNGAPAHLLLPSSHHHSNNQPHQHQHLEDPSVGFSSFGSKSNRSFSPRERSVGAGASSANRSIGSLSKRLSTKSWGSVGSLSKLSRTSSRMKLPWARKSIASVSSNGSEAWLDEEQKAALEATIDFDGIFEGSAVP